MRAVIQRVLSASVSVDGETISSIGKGLLVLVGIDRYDEPRDRAQILKKVLSAKLFDGSEEDGGLWKRSVKDIEGEVLCVSQFTLFANFKGAKPDFHESMSTIPGKAFYHAFLDEMRAAYLPERIKDGRFGAMMQVSLTNDGPVTILLSSRDNGPASTSTSGTSTPAGPAVLSKEEQRARAAAKREAKAVRASVYAAAISQQLPTDVVDAGIARTGDTTERIAASAAKTSEVGLDAGLAPTGEPAAGIDGLRGGIQELNLDGTPKAS